MFTSSVVILALWWLAVAANGWLVIWRLRPWLWRRYPFFACWMIYQLSISLVLLWAGGTGRPHPYAEIWRATQWISAVILAGVTFEAYRALLRRIADIETAARGLFGLLVVVCGAGSLAIGTLDRPWLRLGNGAGPWMLVWQYAAFTLAAICLVSLTFFRRHLKIPMRTNAVRHALTLSGFLGTTFLASLALGLTAGEWRVTASCLMMLGQLAAFVAWAWWMTPRGEVVPFGPRPTLPLAEMRRANLKDERWEREIWEVSSQVLDKAVRRTDS